MAGISVFEEELQYWLETVKDDGSKFSYREAYRKAVDYYRRYSRREYTFFTEEDMTFKQDDNVAATTDLRDAVIAMILNLEDDRDLQLFMVLVKINGIDHIVGLEIFEGIDCYEDLDIPEMPPGHNLRHKDIAGIAGFPTKDKALKSYNASYWRMRETAIKVGLAPEGVTEPHWGLR